MLIRVSNQLTTGTKQSQNRVPQKNKPWYHVLVHEAVLTTYVAERNLEPDESVAPIKHPMLGDFFSRFESGRYVSDDRAN